MHWKRTAISLAITSFFVCSAPVAFAEVTESNGVELPGVPISVTDPGEAPGESEEESTEAQQQAAEEARERLEEIRQGVAEDATQAAEDAASSGEGSDESETDNRVLEVKPGVNEVVEISRGHPNRIVMPFDDPEVTTTTTDAEINVSGRVIYVATGQEGPVTVFVSPKGNEELAISLTFLPRAIPPRSVDVWLSQEISGDGDQPRFGNATAEDWETSNDYTSTLIELFHKLAQQDVPQGYTLRQPNPTDQSGCAPGPGESIEFELGQVAEGHNMMVHVLVARNTGDAPVEIDGSYCAAPGVLAAAEWPRSMLEPGQETEMYVALQRLEESEPERRRPSLIQE